MQDAGALDAGTVDFSECERVDGGNPTCATPVYREYCRVDVLRRGFADGCVTDADCSLVPYAASCISWGLCPPGPAVLSSRMREFEAARDAELGAFCAHAPCHHGGSCAAFDAGVVCRQGRCEGELR